MFLEDKFQVSFLTRIFFESLDKNKDISKQKIPLLIGTISLNHQITKEKYPKQLPIQIKTIYLDHQITKAKIIFNQNTSLDNNKDQQNKKKTSLTVSKYLPVSIFVYHKNPQTLTPLEATCQIISMLKDQARRTSPSKHLHYNQRMTLVSDTVQILVSQSLLLYLQLKYKNKINQLFH